jgi:hypothetical protein
MVKKLSLRQQKRVACWKKRFSMLLHNWVKQDFHFEQNIFLLKIKKIEINR